MTTDLSTSRSADVRFLVSGTRDKLRAASLTMQNISLSLRQLCDLELLLNGGFTPLDGFMNKKAWESVCNSMRLPTGEVWPIPVTLDVPVEFAKKLKLGESIALLDREGITLAILHIEDIFELDKKNEALKVYGTDSIEHPGVRYLYQDTNSICLGGRIEGIELPHQYDFLHLRKTPQQLRDFFKSSGWQKVVAFQTRNPMHRAHFELTLRAAKENDAKLLVHPVVGMTKPGDIDYFTRVRCYDAVMKHYPKDTAILSLLPLSMRMAGPREAVWHSLIRKNHGCTHFIVGRDHAGPGKFKDGRPFYGPYDAQNLMNEYQSEIGIKMVPFREMLYIAEEDRYVAEDEVPPGAKVTGISGTELRHRLDRGLEIPKWFTFPEVAEELVRSSPPRCEQGFTLFFTGLSGSGKSTLSNIIYHKLKEFDRRAVTLLDGDIVRKHLSSELGFSKEHRDINIRRIGFVASEITKSGGIAICAPIAPYDETRKAVRRLVESHGGFILIHLSTSLETCESRDRKGLYAKARAGIVKEFTGISDPYEAPTDAEITLDTAKDGAEAQATMVLETLKQQGYLA